MPGKRSIGKVAEADEKEVKKSKKAEEDKDSVQKTAKGNVAEEFAPASSSILSVPLSVNKRTVTAYYVRHQDSFKLFPLFALKKAELQIGKEKIKLVSNRGKFKAPKKEEVSFHLQIEHLDQNAKMQQDILESFRQALKITDPKKLERVDVDSWKCAITADDDPSSPIATETFSLTQQGRISVEISLDAAAQKRLDGIQYNKIKIHFEGQFPGHWKTSHETFHKLSKDKMAEFSDGMGDASYVVSVTKGRQGRHQSASFLQSVFSQEKEDDLSEDFASDLADALSQEVDLSNHNEKDKVIAFVFDQGKIYTAVAHVGSIEKYLKGDKSLTSKFSFQGTKQNVQKEDLLNEHKDFIQSVAATKSLSPLSVKTWNDLAGSESKWNKHWAKQGQRSVKFKKNDVTFDATAETAGDCDAPVGSVVGWPSNAVITDVAPNWRLCEGGTVPSTECSADLSDLLPFGTTSGDVNLPDYRGIFLEGDTSTRLLTDVQSAGTVSNTPANMAIKWIMRVI